MCEKTVMKRHADRLPKQAQAAQILSAERDVEAETQKLLEAPAPKKAGRPAKTQQTRQLENLSKDEREESDEWRGNGARVFRMPQLAERAPSAAVVV